MIITKFTIFFVKQEQGLYVIWNIVGCFRYLVHFPGIPSPKDKQIKVK